MNQKISNSIGLTTATIVALNAMIGAGIFTSPSKLSYIAGPIGILAYVLVTFAVLCMALTFARLASYYPTGGSFYAYVTPWAGRFGGFIAAILYISGLTVSMSFLNHNAGSYVHTLIPSLSVDVSKFSIAVLLIILNIAGTRISSIGQYVLLGLKSLAFIGVIGLCLSHAQTSNLVPFAPHGISSMFYVLSTVIYAFMGFESVASLAGIIRNPQKNVPLAVILSTIIAGIFYIFFILSTFLGISGSYFSAPDLALGSILTNVFPDYTMIIAIINICITFAFMGVIHSMIWSLGTLTSSLCSITKPLRWINDTYAIAGIGTAILICSFVLQSNVLVPLTALLVVASYALVMISLILEKQEKSLMYKGIAFLGLLSAIVMIVYAVNGILAVI
jgi:amino acid transporter